MPGTFLRFPLEKIPGTFLLPVLNTATGQTHVTTALPPCEIPEPAGAVLVGVALAARAVRGQKKCR